MFCSVILPEHMFSCQAPILYAAGEAIPSTPPDTARYVGAKRCQTARWGLPRPGVHPELDEGGLAMNCEVEGIQVTQSVGHLSDKSETPVLQSYK